MSNVVSANTTNVKQSATTTTSSLIVNDQFSAHRNNINNHRNNSSNKTTSPTILATNKQEPQYIQANNNNNNNHNSRQQKRPNCEGVQIGTSVGDNSPQQNHHHFNHIQEQEANDRGTCMQLLTNLNSVIVDNQAQDATSNCKYVTTAPKSSNLISHQQASTSGSAHDNQLIDHHHQQHPQSHQFETGLTQSTGNKFNTSKGIKRPNKASEKQAIVVASTSSGICFEPYNLSPQQQQISDTLEEPYDDKQLLNSNQDEVVEEAEEVEEEDSEDQELVFDYEPVLAKILNEKKLALFNSPDVIKFISSFQQGIQKNSLGLND